MEYSIAPRKAVTAHLEGTDFDAAVIITYDSHTSLCGNWFHFSGHPSTWEMKELAGLAQQLAAHTAEELKKDVNNPNARQLYVERPRVVRATQAQTNTLYLLLLGFGLGTKSSKKRWWLRFDWSYSEMGIAVRWYGRAVLLLVGPLAFSVTYA